MTALSHLEESLQRDSDQLRHKVVSMTGLAQQALKRSVQALTERNRRLAYSVILRDHYIDELETELDRLCLEFLVRHQPAGVHLRLVYATIQINKELERIGDYAESIARQALAVSALQPQPSYARFLELAHLSGDMLHDAVEAYMQQDPDLAWRTMAIEERANTLRNTINADLAELSRENRIPAAALNPLMTVARRLERAADQSKNICEDVLYMCTGEFVKHKSAEALRIVFVDSTNSALSQMAEGLGRSLKIPRFIFASAGLSPERVDPRAVEFMKGKGVDIATQVSKSIDQVRDWDQTQVIVALGAQIREALPQYPGKSVLLTWSVPDPSAVQGDADHVHKAFETAFLALESNLRDLVGAILDEPQTETKS